MSRLRAWVLRLMGTASGRRREQEFANELDSHLQLHVDGNLRRGLTAEQARREALMKLGGVEQTKELYRERRGLPWLETLLQDLRFSTRALRRNPGFCAVVVATIALGIAANTAIFSVINSVLLRRLPYGNSENLVILWENDFRYHKEHNTVSPPDFLDWQAENDIFTEMAATADQRSNLTGNGEPEQVVVQYVSVNFFSVLGVTPILGPGFIPQNGFDGKDDVVVLSNALWKRRFGADPAIIGKQINVNAHLRTVVGIAPATFDWYIKERTLTGGRPQMWAPLVLPKEFADRKQTGRFLTVVARLKPGITPRQAQSRMDAIAQRLAVQYPEYNANWGVTVVPLREQLSGDLRPALLVLFGAVTLVLLIACANVSSLLLSRAVSREHEVAIRTALGANRWRIAKQLLTESVLLAAVGGALGAALAFWGTNVLLAVSPKNLLDLRTISLDSRLLAFAAAVSVLSGVLFGFVPSYLSARAAIAETLKEGARSATPGRGRRMLLRTFVVAQMALALILLAGSGLLIRSFIRLSGVDPGFNANRLLTFTVALPSSKYSKDPAVLSFFQQLLERLGKLPGVRSVTMENFPPFAGIGSATAVHILRQPLLPLDELPVSSVRLVGQDYFQTMQIPFVAGRTFSEEELAQERHVVIVNQAFVDKYMQDAPPLGQKAAIYMKSLEESGNPPCEIIGVVGNVHLTGLDDAAEPIVYWPHPELVYTRMTILIRTNTDPLALVSAAREQLRQLDPEQPMANIATMEQLLGDSLARSRFTMLLLGIFAAAALVLASVGLYGAISFNVTQRTQEIGIRTALGAQSGDVKRMVIKEGVLLAVLGVIIGSAGALSVTRFLSAFLYHVGSADPLTFTAVALLLAAVALLASYIPARRAARVDPLVALRYE
jgi:putative ABC transport system permease protein